MVDAPMGPKACGRLLYAAREPVSVSESFHILYLDDDIAYAFLIKRVLERKGHRVCCHDDPQAGLAALHAQPSQFDMVLTDLTMPRLTGLAVAEEVKKIRPDMPIALISGRLTEQVRRDASRASISALVSKSEPTSVIAQTVQEVLSKLR